MPATRSTPSTQQPKIIGFHARTVSNYFESLIYYLASNPSCRVLLVTPGIDRAIHPDHPRALKRLQSLESLNLEILDLPEHATPTEYLFFEPNSRGAYRQSLLRWLRVAEKPVFLDGSNRYRSWKSIFRHYSRNLPIYLQAKAILIQEGADIFNPFPFIRNAIHQTINIHPQYLRDDLAGNRKFFLPAPLPEVSRPYRFVFVGNYNPPERQATLATVKDYLSSLEGTTFIRDYEPGQQVAGSGTRILWNAYGDTDEIRGLPGDCYRLAHEESDFSICPLGWGRNWTHRTVESLLRGAIPILEDISRYNLGLEDEKNCIAVRNGDWLEAIQRAYRKTPAEVVRMRCNLVPLRDILLPENMGRVLLDRLP